MTKIMLQYGRQIYFIVLRFLNIYTSIQGVQKHKTRRSQGIDRHTGKINSAVQDIVCVCSIERIKSNKSTISTILVSFTHTSVILFIYIYYNICITGTYVYKVCRGDKIIVNALTTSKNHASCLHDTPCINVHMLLFILR